MKCLSGAKREGEVRTGLVASSIMDWWYDCVDECGIRGKSVSQKNINNSELGAKLVKMDLIWFITELALELTNSWLLRNRIKIRLLTADGDKV